jgi:hypothetical protein
VLLPYQTAIVQACFAVDAIGALWDHALRACEMGALGWLLKDAFPASELPTTTWRDSEAWPISRTTARTTYEQPSGVRLF